MVEDTTLTAEKAVGILMSAQNSVLSHENVLKTVKTFITADVQELLSDPDFFKYLNLCIMQGKKTKEKVQTQRTGLLACNLFLKRAELKQLVKELDEVLKDAHNDLDTSRTQDAMGIDGSQRAIEIQDRNRTTVQLQEAKRNLAKAEALIQRVKSGTYGIEEQSLIPAARMLAAPLTTVSIETKRKQGSTVSRSQKVEADLVE